MPAPQVARDDAYGRPEPPPWSPPGTLPAAPHPHVGLRLPAGIECDADLEEKMCWGRIWTRAHAGLAVLFTMVAGVSGYFSGKPEGVEDRSPSLQADLDTVTWVAGVAALANGLAAYFATPRNRIIEAVKALPPDDLKAAIRYWDRGVARCALWTWVPQADCADGCRWLRQLMLTFEHSYGVGKLRRQVVELLRQVRDDADFRAFFFMCLRCYSTRRDRRASGITQWTRAPECRTLLNWMRRAPGNGVLDDFKRCGPSLAPPDAWTLDRVCIDRARFEFVHRRVQQLLS